MKKLILALPLLLASFPSFAAPLEAIECRPELWRAGLSKVVQSVTFETLNGGSFAISNFDYSERNGYEYTLTVDVKPATEAAFQVEVDLKVLNSKTCEIKAKINAG